jgi:transposase InsO family protein
MTLEDKVHDYRLLVLRRAEEKGSVTAACREYGVSRTLFYRWRARFRRYGADGLHPRRRQASPGRPVSLAQHDERSIVALALSWPTWGPKRLSLQLARDGHSISPSTVYRALCRVGLSTREKRLAVLELRSAERSGLLTERTRRKLERARRRRRHVQAEEPGELVSLDSFYIGKLKGVGKVWQLTACDAASSYAAARIVVGPTAEATARFLREDLVPLYRKAGWPLRRVLTDRGSEFKAVFDEACEKLGIRHTRTQPRHAWTNGFVERLQGTILHEHWRVAFRRRYFTSRQQLQRSLDGFLAFYNEERPHMGYRTKGRTPAEIFWGAVGSSAQISEG